MQRDENLLQMNNGQQIDTCLLYTSPSPRDRQLTK